MKKIDKEEIHSIFKGIKENNELEFNKLYEKYKNLVYGIAFSILKNKEDAEETVQNVFIKIFKLDKEKLPNKNEATWLYTITKNSAISLLRTKKENVDIEKIYEIQDKDVIDDIDSKIEFNRLINRLNDTEKEIISLKVSSDLSFNEIAACLNKSVGTVKWKYYKAVNTLKILISNATMFVITFIIGIMLKLQDRKLENYVEMGENQDKQKEETNTSNTTDTENKGNEETKSETLRGDNENNLQNVLDQETTTQIDKSEDVIIANSRHYGTISLCISAVFLLLTIIFSYFFIKYRLKSKVKTSK